MGSTICPACRLPMEITPEMAGQAMACPRCGAQFVVPPAAGPAPPPLQPAAASTQPPQFIRRRTVRRPFQDEATSLLDLFDLSFTRYVTPLIVKITWVMALLLAAVWLVAIVVALAGDLIPEREVAKQVEPQPGRPRIEFRAPEFGDRVERATSDTALRVILLITQIVAVILFLLWVRVALEAVIVIFHIAASVRSIDEKTPRDSG